MLYRHVFDKISTEFCGILCVFVDFADLPEFRGSARNIRSPGYKKEDKFGLEKPASVSVLERRRTLSFFR